MEVVHHGGKASVTGSCHELRADGQALLIDCGLFQGADERPLTVEFALGHVDALILTHAHIDHIGRLPWLLAAGFKQPIYCTSATAELVPLMLEDGLKLQLGMSPKQSERVLTEVRRLLRVQDYQKWFAVQPKRADSLWVRFQPAGHILGSAYVEIRRPNGEVVVFSGDLGPSHTPLLPDPQSPERADYLFIETTYGDKQHEDVQSRGQRLRAMIERSLTDGGAILIPAFSVGRTQELLFDIEQLIFSQQIDANLPIILDSPMAQRVTRSGRIMDYLKALMPDKRTDLILAGFQAEGTLGRSIQSGQPSVWIEGTEVEVNAHIHTMSGYSAHADKADLLRFITGIPEKPKQVHLIHGEASAKQAFAAELTQLGYSVL
ncbi:MBL fold metallo-hydrolase RNA specificity domain-containing protein [Vibrio cholerae]